MTIPLPLKKVYGNHEGAERKVILQIVVNLRQKYIVTLILEVLDVLWATYDRWAKEGMGEQTSIETAVIALCQKTKYRGYGFKHLLQKE